MILGWNVQTRMTTTPSDEIKCSQWKHTTKSSNETTAKTTQVEYMNICLPLWSGVRTHTLINIITTDAQNKTLVSLPHWRCSVDNRKKTHNINPPHLYASKTAVVCLYKYNRYTSFLWQIVNNTSIMNIHTGMMSVWQPFIFSSNCFYWINNHGDLLKKKKNLIQLPAIAHSCLHNTDHRQAKKQNIITSVWTSFELSNVLQTLHHPQTKLQCNFLCMCWRH